MGVTPVTADLADILTIPGIIAGAGLAMFLILVVTKFSRRSKLLTTLSVLIIVGAAGYATFDGYREISEATDSTVSKVEVSYGVFVTDYPSLLLNSSNVSVRYPGFENKYDGVMRRGGDGLVTLSIKEGVNVTPADQFKPRK